MKLRDEREPIRWEIEFDGEWATARVFLDALREDEDVEDMMHLAGQALDEARAQREALA